jgi:hypothetical protein
MSNLINQFEVFILKTETIETELKRLRDLLREVACNPTLSDEFKEALSLEVVKYITILKSEG